MAADQEQIMMVGSDLMAEILNSFESGTKVSIVIRTNELKTLVLTNEEDLNDLLLCLQAICAPEGTLH